MVPSARAQRRVVLASFGAMAVVLTVGGFLLGSRMATSAASAPSPTTVSAPVAAASAAPSTRAATPAPSALRRLGPGDHGRRSWDALTGGECLRSFSSPWQPSYTVVACRTTHAAQVLRTVALPEGAYPSRGELEARLGGTCQAAVSLAAASRYRGVRVSASYPTAAEWTAGDRRATCFVSRAGGGAITGSLLP